MDLVEDPLALTLFQPVGDLKNLPRRHTHPGAMAKGRRVERTRPKPSEVTEKNRARNTPARRKIVKLLDYGDPTRGVPTRDELLMMTSIFARQVWGRGQGHTDLETGAVIGVKTGDLKNLSVAYGVLSDKLTMLKTSPVRLWAEEEQETARAQVHALGQRLLALAVHDRPIVNKLAPARGASA